MENTCTQGNSISAILATSFQYSSQLYLKSSLRLNLSTFIHPIPDNIALLFSSFYCGSFDIRDPGKATYT